MRNRASVATPYHTMEFPEYEYREYPKMVYPEGLTHSDDHPEIHLRGKPRGVEVHSVEEERGVLAAHNAANTEPAGRAELRRQLSQLGVQVDPLWSIGRLYKELAQRAAALSQQFQASPGQEALAADPGIAQFGSSGESETSARYGESFNRQPDIRENMPAQRMTEMDELKQQAAALDIKVDGRWSADRLRQEISRVLEEPISNAP